MTGSSSLIKGTKSNYKRIVKKWAEGTDLDREKELVYCPDDRQDYTIYNNVFKYAFSLNILVKVENIHGTPYGKIRFYASLN